MHRQLRIEALESRSLLSIDITGLHHEQIKISNPGDGAVINLQGGTFLALEDTHFPLGEPLPDSWPARYTHPEWESSTAEKYPVSIKGTSSNVVIDGGTVYGLMDDRAPWGVWKDYSDGDGLRVEGSVAYEIKNTFVSNVFDGIAPRGSVAATFNIHDVFLDKIKDDMVENDDIHSGTIANSYMRGFVFLSARGGSTIADTNAVVQVKNMVVELQLQPFNGFDTPTDLNTDGGYPYPDGLGTGSIFKWADYAGTVDVRDSVFLVPRHSASSNKAMNFAPGTYQNVTVVWLGEGAYPWPAPEGVTITTDRTAFDRAVAEFFNTHPQFTSSVTATHLFYKGSTKWNVTNNNLPGFSDDNAIAPDKTAYLPGSGTSTFSAVSSYDKGINGLMVDIAGPHGAITASDFIFKVGNNNSPSTWATATGPTTVTTRAGAGTGGADRIELLWADGAIQTTWLEVIVKGNDTLGGSNTNTGLPSSYVFIFGNARGDGGAADATAFSVTSSDEIQARNNPKGLPLGTNISDVNDHNRDGFVNSSDQTICRNNVTGLGNQLKFLVVSGGGPFAPQSSSSGGGYGPTTAEFAQAASAAGDSGIASALATLSAPTSTAVLSSQQATAMTAAADSRDINPTAESISEHLVQPRAFALAVDEADMFDVEEEVLEAIASGSGVD